MDEINKTPQGILDQLERQAKALCVRHGMIFKSIQDQSAELAPGDNAATMTMEGEFGQVRVTYTYTFEEGTEYGALFEDGWWEKCRTMKEAFRLLAQQPN